MQTTVVEDAHERDAVVGSDGWRIVPELSPGDAEPPVEKLHGDSFEGASTDQCVRSTIHGGVIRGYDVTLVDFG